MRVLRIECYCEACYFRAVRASTNTPSHIIRYGFLLEKQLNISPHCGARTEAGQSLPQTKYPELDVSRVERERRQMQIEVPQVRLCLETPRSVARVESLATCPFCLPPAPSWCSSQIQAEALLCQAEALLCLAEERELGFACVAVQAVHRRSKPNP